MATNMVPSLDRPIYGTNYMQSQFAGMPAWQQGLTAGMSDGRRMFYDDPDMQQSRARLEDLQKGYDGKQLGAMRESSRQSIAGQRAGYMGQLHANLAKQGVGGARAAAVGGAADQKFAQTGAEAERKMTVDNAALVTKGTSNLNDYLMKQKYGQLTTASGYGQLASAQYAADRGVNAANSGNKGAGNFQDFSKQVDEYFGIG